MITFQILTILFTVLIFNKLTEIHKSYRYKLKKEKFIKLFTGKAISLKIWHFNQFSYLRNWRLIYNALYPFTFIHIIKRKAWIEIGLNFQNAEQNLMFIKSSAFNTIFRIELFLGLCSCSRVFVHAVHLHHHHHHHLLLLLLLLNPPLTADH